MILIKLASIGVAKCSLNTFCINTIKAAYLGNQKDNFLMLTSAFNKAKIST